MVIASATATHRKVNRKQTNNKTKRRTDNKNVKQRLHVWAAAAADVWCVMCDVCAWCMHGMCFVVQNESWTPTSDVGGATTRLHTLKWKLQMEMSSWLHPYGECEMRTLRALRQFSHYLRLLLISCTCTRCQNDLWFIVFLDVDRGSTVYSLPYD